MSIAKTKISFPKSHPKVYHSTRRRTDTLILQISELMQRVESLPKEISCPQTIKHQNMARIYLRSAVMELGKMSSSAYHDHNRTLNEIIIRES